MLRDFWYKLLQQWGLGDVGVDILGFKLPEKLLLWQFLQYIRSFRHILAKHGEYCQYLLDIGNIRQILTISGVYWQYMMRFVSFRRVLPF